MLRRPLLLPRLLLALVALLVLALVAGCATEDQGSGADPDQVDAVEAPRLGACRDLAPRDLALPSNATRSVSCREDHTAETFLVATFPESLRDLEVTDDGLAAYASRACSARFATFVGTDESTALRSLLSYVWFRPSARAWDKGARWFRCDAVAGTQASTSLPDLPPTARGLLAGRPDDRWLACVAAPTVQDAPRVPCSTEHRWRAVTTIKVGEETTPWPGTEVVAQRTRQFCDGSVRAWLDYPEEYDYGYTFFGPEAWAAGNRRSVCWAKTDQ